MTDLDLDSDLEELSSAEDFLNYFGIEFDPRVVHVNRLHILQRFHDYLAQAEEIPEGDAQRWALYADLLAGAYQDFVESDALTEKVFRVFKRGEPQVVMVPLADLIGSPGGAA